MKKVYLFLAIVWLGCLSANAQFQRTVSSKNHIPVRALHANHMRAAAPSGNNQINSVLWSDDFSNPSNWTVSHTAGVGDWVIGTNPPSGGAAINPINSTTAANGFALFDSDFLCDTSQIANMTNATPINLTGHPNVRLNFSQYYRRFVDSTFVLVSNDGTTWTKFDVNKDLQPFQFNENHRSHNPSNVVINISSVAGNQDSVWIRFQFYSPGLLGPAAGCAYAWQIDDVGILDIDSTDARLSTAFAGDYTEIPIIQPEAFQLRGKVINNGLAAISGAKISFTVFDAQFVQLYADSSTASSSINPGDTSAYLYAAAGPYTIPDTGVYYIQQTVFMPGDTTNFNDNDIAIIYVNDSTYARDYTAIDGDLSDAYGFPAGSFPNGGYFGQSYHIHRSSAVTSATFLLLQPQINAQIRVQLYSMSSGVPSALLGSSATYTITAFDTANFDFMTLPFQNQISVTPGDYLLVINQMDTNFLSIGASTDIVTPGSLFFKSASPNFSALPFQLSFILRLNNPSSTFVGITEAEKNAAFYVYPNPTNGIIHIAGTDEKNVRINVLNPLGQIVKTELHETFHSSQIDLSGFPKGIYTVNIHTATSDINKTVVLN